MIPARDPRQGGFAITASQPARHPGRQAASLAARQPSQPDSQATRQPDSQAIRQPGSQTARQPDSQAARQPDSQPSSKATNASILRAKMLIFYWFLLGKRDFDHKNVNISLVLEGFTKINELWLQWRDASDHRTAATAHLFSKYA